MKRSMFFCKFACRTFSRRSFIPSTSPDSLVIELSSGCFFSPSCVSPTVAVGLAGGEVVLGITLSLQNWRHLAGIDV